jgi:hypothetical protein
MLKPKLPDFILLDREINSIKETIDILEEGMPSKALSEAIDNFETELFFKEKQAAHEISFEL